MFLVFGAWNLVLENGNLTIACVDLQSVPCTKLSFNFPICRPSGTLCDSGIKCYKYLAPLGLSIGIRFFGIRFFGFGAWNLVLENWNLNIVGADLQSVSCTKLSFNLPICRPSGTLYDSEIKCYKYAAPLGL